MIYLELRNRLKKTYSFSISMKCIICTSILLYLGTTLLVSDYKYEEFILNKLYRNKPKEPKLELKTYILKEFSKPTFIR